MKIAYCIHSLYYTGGIERVVSLKASYLADSLGYEVYILTAHQRGKAPFYELSDKVRVVDLGVSDNFIFTRPLYKARLRRALREIRPDITISTGKREMLYISGMDDGSVKMTEYHFSHQRFFNTYPDNAIGRLQARRHTRTVEKAASRMKAFVVLTEQDAEVWRKILGNVHHICNPLTFTSEESADTSVCRAIAVGRLVHQKNFKDLVEAWRAVAKKHPQWTLDIFGDGEQRQLLSRMIDEYGLGDKVFLRGNVKDVKVEMLSHSFLVMCSLFEGFPMVLLEASECGLPLVSYDCPTGPSNIISEGKNGYLVPAGDVEGLSDAICRMMENPDRESFGKESKKVASAFSMPSIMKQWDELFRSLVKES